MLLFVQLQSSYMQRHEYWYSSCYNGLIHGDMFENEWEKCFDIIQRAEPFYIQYVVQNSDMLKVLKARQRCVEANPSGIVVIETVLEVLTFQKLLCVGLPGTMTCIAWIEYTIGYDIAMNTAMEMWIKLEILPNHMTVVVLLK